MNEHQAPGGINSKMPLTFRPKTKSDYLALKIARAFSEEHKLPMYRACCENFEESGILKAFSETMAVPDDKIRKSRPALFVHLMKKYAKRK
jgi:hypothetical protein